MLPPTLVRRFALVPLVVVIAACLVALTPLVALASCGLGAGQTVDGTRAPVPAAAGGVAGAHLVRR